MIDTIKCVEDEGRLDRHRAIAALVPPERAAQRVDVAVERESHEIAAHRLASVQEAAERFACVVVLKGPDTLVAAPGRGILVSSLGLPSLATAGSGDVLTGVVATFLAKGLEPQLAAAAAAAAQQRASVEAPQRADLVAGDLIDALPRALA